MEGGSEPLRTLDAQRSAGERTQRLHAGPRLDALDLEVSLAWRVLGAQAFMVAEPTGD